MAGCYRKDFICITFDWPLQHYQACSDEKYSRSDEKYSRSFEKKSRSYEKFSRLFEKKSRLFAKNSRSDEKYSRLFEKKKKIFLLFFFLVFKLTLVGFRITLCDMKIIFSFMLFNEVQRFLGEIETDNFTMKMRLLDFHCLGLLFSLLFYEFWAKSLAQKV